MKVQFVSQKALDLIKISIPSWTEHFKENSSDWLTDELKDVLDTPIFRSTAYNMPDLNLDVSDEKPLRTDAENVRRVYGSLQNLSPSDASDERLWAGLCLGPCWNYVKYRWDIDSKCTASNIEQHFFFAYTIRRSLMRNAVSRLWWIGKLTYEEGKSDPWEQTEFVCRNSDYIMHILERNTSNNPAVLHPFISALMDAEKDGACINTDTVGYLSKHLNILGGTYILDCLPEQTIHDKIYAEAMKIGN